MPRRRTPVRAAARQAVGSAAGAMSVAGRRKPRRRRGFTLVELMVSIGIIAVLLAILLPTLRGARDRALGIQCQANLRELYAAQLGYAADHRGRFTPMSQSGDRWEQLLGPYVTRAGHLPRQVMHCPATDKAASAAASASLYSTYALNPALQMQNWRFRRDARMDASRIILMGDKAEHQLDDFLTTFDGWFVLADDRAGQWWQYRDHAGAGSLRHGGKSGRSHMLMADGHVAPMGPRELCRDSGHWYWGGVDGMPAYSVAAGCCP